VENASDRQGDLILRSEGNVNTYEFTGGEFGYNLNGIWSVEGTTINVLCDDTGDNLSGTIIFISDDVMKVKSATNKALFSLYSSPQTPNPVEQFTYRGKN
jgi:hypothetical protein